MICFELLEHPADVGFRATAASLEELWAACAQALVSIILDAAAAVPTNRFTLAAEGIELESLSIKWLNQRKRLVTALRLGEGW